MGEEVYKVPIAGIKDVTLSLAKKTKTLEFVIVMDEAKQNKALGEWKMKPIKKGKRNFEIENYEIARTFLAVLCRNFIILTGGVLPVVDHVSAKDLGK